MKRSETFVDSLSKEHLDLYRFLPDRMEQLQLTLAHRAFRLALAVKYGKGSEIFQRSSYAAWLEEVQDGLCWEANTIKGKRALIEAAVDYAIYFRGRHPRFERIARFLPNRANYAAMEIELLVALFDGRAGLTGRRHQSKFRIAFVLFGDVTGKREMVHRVVEWLNLVLASIQAVVYFSGQDQAFEMPKQANMVYRHLSELKGRSALDNALDGRETTFHIRQSKETSTRSQIHLMLWGIDCDVLVVSPAAAELDPVRWREHILRYCYSADDADPSLISKDIASD